MLRKHDALLLIHDERLNLNTALGTDYLGFDNWFKKDILHNSIEEEDFIFELTA